MKYLKSFMITESELISFSESELISFSESELISLVNKDIINDLKDLSIYIMDEGYNLLITFYCDNKSIGSVEINHHMEEYIPYHLPGNKIDKYSFQYYKDEFNSDPLKCTTKRFINKEDIIEILDRIKHLYPEENFSTRIN